MAVSGIVRIRAPAVVARFDVMKLMMTLGTFFLYFLLKRKESAIAEFIRGVTVTIPSVAENDNCKPTDAHEYGLKASKARRAVESDVKLSLSRRKSGAHIRNTCIILARETAGVNPVIAIKKNNAGMPITEKILLFLIAKERKPIRNDMCIPDIDTICTMPEADKEAQSAESL